MEVAVKTSLATLHACRNSGQKHMDFASSTKVLVILVRAVILVDASPNVLFVLFEINKEK